MMISVFCPIAACAVRPNIRSAARFQLSMTPSMFSLMIASSEDSTTAARSRDEESGSIKDTHYGVSGQAGKHDHSNSRSVLTGGQAPSGRQDRGMSSFRETCDFAGNFIVVLRYADWNVTV